MRKFFISLLLIIIAAIHSTAQKKDYLITMNMNSRIEKDIKVIFGINWSVLNYTIGEINNDSLPDIIAVGSSLVDESKYRKIYLFINKGKKRFEIASTNENIIQCSDCGGGGVGDPLQAIVIKKNYFSIEQLYGDCDKVQMTTIFKYDKLRKWWFLHKDVQEVYNCKPDANDEIKTSWLESKKKDYGKLRFEDYK